RRRLLRQRRRQRRRALSRAERGCRRRARARRRVRRRPLRPPLLRRERGHADRGHPPHRPRTCTRGRRRDRLTRTPAARAGRPAMRLATPGGQTMRRATLLTPTLALALALAPAPALLAQPADLILTGARVWTGATDGPGTAATAIAIAGDRILAVGTDAELATHRGPATRVIDLAGRFIAPGFIDNHTHFAQAGALLLGVNLLDVADEAGLARRAREARDRMPAGAWLVGGDWGAYAAWAMGATGREGEQGRAAATPFQPHRAMIDSITPSTPALLSKWDRSAYL